MTPSKLFLYFCLSFVFGIFVGSFWGFPAPLDVYYLMGLILGILLISVFWPKRKLAVVGFCILFLVLGIWCYQQTELKITNNELEKFNDLDQKITLVGIVDDEPNIGASTIKLTISTEQLLTDPEGVALRPYGVSNQQLKVSGKILVTTYRYPEYKYGDKLKIIGKLETPPILEGFNYKDFLKKEGIYSVMSWPKIELLGQGFGNPIMKTLFSLKNRLEESLNKIMSPPESAILEALFFGDEKNLSKDWKDKLNITSTRHITAVSGMNITIIANILMGFLISIGFWRKQAFYFVVIFLIFYILMIGAPASAVRAGIMAGLLLLAQHIGRLNSASRAIVFASVLMLAINPLLLRFDVGFQLSFLAVMGMIYFGPYFYEKFKKVPEIFGIRLALTSTISAQIFTLPILIYNFGRISLFSVPVNILIVPWLPLITVYGFLIAFLGIFFLSFSQILSWPVWLILSIFTKIIDFISNLKFAALTLKNVPWILPIIFYLLLGWIIFKLKRKSISGGSTPSGGRTS